MSDLQQRLEAFLSAQCRGTVTVSELSRLPGGASRETWSFVATLPKGSRRLILRRDPTRSVAGNMARDTEFELLRRAADGGVPVPRVLWVSADPEILGAPFFVMEFIEGETIARKILRDEEYAPARPAMASQCGEILARLHAVDVRGIEGFVPPDGNPAVESLERFRMLMDSFGEPHPAFEMGLRWLEQRAPTHSRVTLVHGDFRIGNLIVGPDGVRAVLDWELAHLGDPYEDLGWLCTRAWRFGSPGAVGGFGRREDLYAAYERASGMAVDEQAARWWEVMGSLKWGVMCIGQSFTHLWGHVRSVELAAIGRRAVENEFDLLQLID